jgi:hypothetical protein
MWFNDYVMDSLAESVFFNKQKIKDWYRISDVPIMQTNFDYLILVKDQNMVNAVTGLKNWKESIGHKVRIETIDKILEQYTGADTPEKIWNFLHDNCPAKVGGIRYVLLVGDIDVIPMRLLIPSDKDWAYGADYYYAKVALNSHADWDKDSDKRFGEFVDDNFDPLPDVFVGRIPFNDSATVQTICQYIVNFDNNISAWKKNILYAHGVMNYQTNGAAADARSVAEFLTQMVFAPAGWGRKTLYENVYLTPAWNPDYVLDAANYIQAQTSGNFGLTNLCAHGNPTGMHSVRYMGDANNNGKFDNDADVGWNSYSRTSDVMSSNTVEGVVFCNGCSTGVPYVGGYGDQAPDYSRRIFTTPQDNQGKYNLLHGASAVIASTAGSDGDPSVFLQLSGYPYMVMAGDGYADSFNCFFYYRVILQKQTVGEAFYLAGVDYAKKYALRRGVRVFYLLGDPDLHVEGVLPMFQGVFMELGK